MRTRFIRSAASSRSRIVNAGSRPQRSAYSRSSRAPMRVEGAGPRQRRVRHARPAFAEAGDDAFHAPRHLRRRAARERQQQDRARVDAASHQAGDAVRERVGLAGARAGDDQQRPAVGAIIAVEPVARSGALLSVQAREQAVDAGGGRCGVGEAGAERASQVARQRRAVDCKSIQYTRCSPRAKRCAHWSRALPGMEIWTLLTFGF